MDPVSLSLEAVVVVVQNNVGLRGQCTPSLTSIPTPSCVDQGLSCEGQVLRFGFRALSDESPTRDTGRHGTEKGTGVSPVGCPVSVFPALFPPAKVVSEVGPWTSFFLITLPQVHGVLRVPRTRLKSYTGTPIVSFRYPGRDGCTSPSLSPLCRVFLLVTGRWYVHPRTLGLRRRSRPRCGVEDRPGVDPGVGSVGAQDTPLDVRQVQD